MDEVMAELKFHGGLPEFLSTCALHLSFMQRRRKSFSIELRGFPDISMPKPANAGLLPRQRFAIIPVPDDIAPFYTSGRGGLGVYLVNTYDLPSRIVFIAGLDDRMSLRQEHAMQMSTPARTRTYRCLDKTLISPLMARLGIVRRAA